MTSSQSPFERAAEKAQSLKQWAERLGVSYRTAWRMVKANKVPEPFRAVQFDTGTIRIIEGSPSQSNVETPKTVIYVRINPRSDESELLRQTLICTDFCLANGWTVEQVVREKAPGFGPKRQKLHRLLIAPPSRLVVARPSVLSRFDLSVIEILLRNSGCELKIVRKEEQLDQSQGALEDLTDAISATCNLHFGLKRGRALVEDLNRVAARGSRLLASR